MKTEYFPVVVAIVAAAASIGSVAFTQNGATKLERQKWEQSTSDAKRKALEEAVFSYARDIGAAIQRTELLTWTAINDPVEITQKTLLEHDKGASETLAKIAGHRIVLSAQSPTVETRTAKAANAYYLVDECISKASAELRRQRAAGLNKIASCQSLAKEASATMPAEFSAVLTEGKQGEVQK